VKVRRALALAAMGLLVVPDLVVHHHGGPPWHAWPGFDLAFGVVGCAVIVIASKALGRAFLQRPDGPGDQT
jgi:hypothetical protein